MNYKCREVVEYFNNKYTIKEVVETCTGRAVKGKSLACPIHNGDNKNGASIDLNKNIFTCWTHNCIRGAKPFDFVKEYYKLEKFTDILEKINYIFRENLTIYEPKKEEKSLSIFDKELKVKKYLSEVNNAIEELMEENNHILINANTGLGKTYAISELVKNNITMDRIIFIAPIRAIAEQVAKDYGFTLYYGDDLTLPNDKLIVTTYHKAPRVASQVEDEERLAREMGELPKAYMVIVDEIHELQAKRNLLEGKQHIIEGFIKNSDKSILMSANTEYINKAYKGILFDKYIKVEPREVIYNAKNLNIKRLPKGTEVKRAITLNLIVEELSKYKNVIFFEDSKEELKYYSESLNALGVDNILINAENKTEEDIQKEYKDIIENSKLNKTVILVTSLINTGVNIKEDRVSLIVKQERRAFDSQKIEQFLARVRTTNNNLTVLLGSTQEELKNKVIPYDFYYNSLLRACNNATIEFNGYNAFRFEDEELKLEIVTKDWNKIKNNEGYKRVKDILFLKNGFLLIDEPMLIEKARLEYEKANYYNDKFILDLLKSVKAESHNITYVAPIKVEKKEKAPTGGKAIDVAPIKANKKEFLDYILEDKKTKDLGEELKEFNSINNDKKLYKELKSETKKLLKPFKDSNLDLEEILSLVVEVYTEEELSKKARIETIENIKRREIYNKLFPIGTEIEDIKYYGDTAYTVARHIGDIYYRNENSLNRGGYKQVIAELIALREYEVIEGADYYLDTNKKKVKRIEVEREVKEVINAIYEVTNKGYIVMLR